MTLDEAQHHIGHSVVYRPGFDGNPEDGVITSVGRVYVFVRYHWQHPCGDGIATAAGQLELAHVPPL